MVKVISLKSGKRLNRQNTKSNDKLINQEGRYIGVLPSEDAEFMRKWHDRLTYEQAQIHELIEEYEKNHMQYLTDLTSMMLYLGFDPESYDPTKERLFISEDGHIWLIEKKGRSEEHTSELQSRVDLVCRLLPAPYLRPLG